jgi:hypothetical protein
MEGIPSKPRFQELAILLSLRLAVRQVISNEFWVAISVSSIGNTIQVLDV